MVDHGHDHRSILQTWSTMVRPWSIDGHFMVDHGQTMVDHGLTMILLQGYSEPFPQKRIFQPHRRQNKLFRLPTLNKTNHSPVFQTSSNTVIQCTSFNVKPTKMLSDSVAEAFGLIHCHPRVKNFLQWPATESAFLKN